MLGVFAIFSAGFCFSRGVCGSLSDGLRQLMIRDGGEVQLRWCGNVSELCAEIEVQSVNETGVLQ